MKKITVMLILCVVTSFTMSACNRKYRYNYRQPIENVVSITFVDENGQSMIAEEKYEALLSDIQELSCKKYWNDPVVELTMPYIIIKYDNGCCEKISAFCSYYETGDRHKTEWLHFIDIEGFAQVLNSYK